MASRPPTPDSASLLTTLAQRSALALPQAAALVGYLGSVGLTDPAVWSAFRLGAGSPSLVEGLTPDDWAVLRKLGMATKLGLVLAGVGGLNLPTFDPREPDRVLGFIRMNQAQDKHRVSGVPKGVAGAVGLGQEPRIIMVDAPLVGLRLAQAGVAGVVVVEDPVVLPPMLPWLAERSVVITCWRKANITAMRTALGHLGESATVLPISGNLAQSPITSLQGLGLDVAALTAKPPKPDLTPIHLRDLIDYAQGRLGSGEATNALEVLGAHQPSLVEAYRIGFLPADFRQALHSTLRRALEGNRIAGGLMLPAFDAAGIAVDALIVHPRVGGRANDGIALEPLGLLAPEISRSHDDIIVTDTFRWLARLCSEGYANVQLLRGPVDAERNAARLAAAGVRRVQLRARQFRDRIAQALHAVGITVVVNPEPVTDGEWTPAAAPSFAPPASSVLLARPAPAAPVVGLVVDPVPMTAAVASAPVDAALPPRVSVEAPAPVEVSQAAAPLHLVDFSTEKNVAIFEVGPLRYAIEVAETDLSLRQVTVRRGQDCHQDRITLDQPAQCRRFATSAGQRVGIDAHWIEAHLADGWRQVREREAQADALPTVAVTGAERTEAEAMLRDPDLLRRIDADLSAMGWVGESRAKGLLYLTAVSRLLHEPLWSVYRATTGAAPWKSIGIITALIPPEECVVFHRLTESVLRRTDQRALKHRLLLVDRAETLRPEGAIALRCLREWGSIGWQQVAQAEGAGSPGLLGAAKGPVAVLAAAASDLDPRCRDCFLTVRVDDSPEQTARTLADQRRHHGPGGALAVNVPAIIRRHHALQRLLRPATVVIPFAERIAFPMTSVRHRDEQEAFLSLIMASALLHQFQRTRDTDGALLAEEADFHHAVAVAGHLLGSSGDGLSEQARHLVQRLFAAGITEFVLSDLGGLVTDWTYYTYRGCAEELVQMGYCSAVGGGQGRARRYARIAQGSAVVGIALLPVGSGTDRMSTLRPFETFCGASQGSIPVTVAG